MLTRGCRLARIHDGSPTMMGRLVGEIELHAAYIPPGSSHGWLKIDTLEGIFRRLAQPSTRPRILCGDFNTPQAERADGRIITWANACAATARSRSTDRSEISRNVGTEPSATFSKACAHTISPTCSALCTATAFKSSAGTSRARARRRAGASITSSRLAA